jgi:hypothetical protein
MSSRSTHSSFRWWAGAFLACALLAHMFLNAATAHAEGFYIKGSISMLYKHSEPEPKVFTWQSMDCGQYWCTAGNVRSHTFYDMRPHDRNYVRNPYLGGAVGFDYEWRSFRFDLQFAGHMSSVSTGRDRGDTSASLDVYWYPFGGR